MGMTYELMREKEQNTLIEALMDKIHWELDVIPDERALRQFARSALHALLTGRNTGGRRDRSIRRIMRIALSAIRKFTTRDDERDYLLARLLERVIWDLAEEYKIKYKSARILCPEKLYGGHRPTDKVPRKEVRERNERIQDLRDDVLKFDGVPPPPWLKLGRS